MRVAVVSPETIHHRDADDTRRLQRLLRGLAERDHEVTVCCARWWGGDGTAAGAATVADGAVPAAGGADERDDGGSEAASAGDESDPDGSERDEDGANGEGAERHRDDEPTPADPDALPPAGTPDPGPSEEPSFGPEADGDDQGVASTLTVDGITYRAVVADAADVRSFATRAPLSIRRADPDVIHAIASPPAVVVGARVGATMARAPLLAEWYDPSGADAGAWTTRQALRRAGRIVTPSRLTRRQLLELGADDASLRVVPNAIDVDAIQSTEPGDGGDVVYARRLDQDANLESLFLGLAELRDRGWSATVIGDGPARREYEQQARDLRIDDRITWAGACDREERIAVYRDAHAFVQTARRCVFPTELLWALACGCVGIVEYHADSSAHELVEGRERGFRTTTPQETAQAIRDAGDLEVLTVDESYASFDAEEVYDQYVGQYEELREEWGLF